LHGADLSAGKRRDACPRRGAANPRASALSVKDPNRQPAADLAVVIGVVGGYVFEWKRADLIMQTLWDLLHLSLFTAVLVARVVSGSTISQNALTKTSLKSNGRRMSFTGPSLLISV